LSSMRFNTNTSMYRKELKFIYHVNNLHVSEVLIKLLIKGGSVRFYFFFLFQQNIFGIRGKHRCL